MDGASMMPSAVYAGEDGKLVVGREAGGPGRGPLRGGARGARGRGFPRGGGDRPPRRPPPPPARPPSPPPPGLPGPPPPPPGKPTAARTCHECLIHCTQRNE